MFDIPVHAQTKMSFLGNHGPCIISPFILPYISGPCILGGKVISLEQLCTQDIMQ